MEPYTKRPMLFYAHQPDMVYENIYLQSHFVKKFNKYLQEEKMICKLPI